MDSPGSQFSTLLEDLGTLTKNPLQVQNIFVLKTQLQ